MSMSGTSTLRVPSAVALSILLVLASTQAATAARASVPSDPARWMIDEKYVFTPDGKPAGPHIEDLLEALRSEDGDGEPATGDDLLNLLRRPEAKEVYVGRLVRYASPHSIEIQEKEHEQYTNVHMKDERIQAGVEFWEEHEDLLSAAEHLYGVPAKDIIAILMWESSLGKFTGDYRVFNVYMGQLLFLDAARDHAVRELRQSADSLLASTDAGTEEEAERLERIKSRAAKNLAALIRLCREAGIDPLDQMGSWGGAIGYPQFLPASMTYAADGDGDGVIDLLSWPDAIHSVASYLNTAGRYGRTEKRRWDAIHSYNPSRSYVDGVIAYADAVAARRL